MTTIRSLKNDRVRLVRALQERRRVRQRERRFVVEGARLCEEVARAGLSPQFVFYTAEAQADPRVGALLQTWIRAGVSCEEVSPEVMAACSDTETPQGLLVVAPLRDLPRPPQPTLTLILDRLREPGNLGTILRTALAAGVDQALLAPGTVDATNPKAIRGGMGAGFYLPVAAMDWDEIGQAVAGCRVYLATAKSATLYTQVDWTKPAALVIGGEAEGAGDQAHALADEEIAIPLHSGVESLNAAAAAAVILFEAARQKAAGATQTPGGGMSNPIGKYHD